MKTILTLAAAAAGYLYLRRSRPGAAQQLEGKARNLAGRLTGRNDMRAEGAFDDMAGGVRDSVNQTAGTSA